MYTGCLVVVSGCKLKPWTLKAVEEMVVLSGGHEVRPVCVTWNQFMLSVALYLSVVESGRFKVQQHFRKTRTRPYVPSHLSYLLIKSMTFSGIRTMYTDDLKCTPRSF